MEIDLEANNNIMTFVIFVDHATPGALSGEHVTGL